MQISTIRFTRTIITFHQCHEVNQYRPRHINVTPTSIINSFYKHSPSSNQLPVLKKKVQNNSEMLIASIVDKSRQKANAPRQVTLKTLIRSMQSLTSNIINLDFWRTKSPKIYCFTLLRNWKKE